MKSVALALSLLAAVAACERPLSAAPDASKELRLRAYPVSAAYAPQLRSVVNGLLNNASLPVGRASLSPDGQLLVIGSEDIQRGVADLITQLGKSGPPPPPTAVEIQYWFVLGTPAKETMVPPGLAEIRGALEALKPTQGPMAFATLERLKLTSNTDEDGEVLGRVSAVKQVASVSGGKVVAQIRMEPLGPAKLNTRVSLTPEQTLILGETGYEVRPDNSFHPGPGEPDLTAKDDVRLYYVIRAAIRDAGH